MWKTQINFVEHLGERVRVGAPLPLTAEITEAAVGVIKAIQRGWR